MTLTDLTLFSVVRKWPSSIFTDTLAIMRPQSKHVFLAPHPCPSLYDSGSSMYLDLPTAADTPRNIKKSRRTVLASLTLTRPMFPVDDEDYSEERQDTSPGREGTLLIMKERNVCWEKGTKAQYEDEL